MVELAHDLGWTKSRNARNAWRYGGNSLPSEMIALEPRVMLDGAAAVAAFAEADDQPAESADNAAAGDASADPAAQAANSESENGGNNSESADTGQVGSTDAQSVIIIDASIADAESLLTGVDPSAHIFYLDAGSDGIQQITNILAGFSNVSDLHILSHGSTGSITLGATTVDTSNIESYASQFVEWDVALTEGADILLYGCNVGQDDAGMDFIDLFADLTNADVAASTDLTGSADLGGNWQLEVGTGSIEATLPLSETAQNAYDHVLAPPVISNFDGGATYTEGGTARRIDGDVQISDVESDALNGGNGDYAGAGFVLERTGGGNVDDFFQFAPNRGVAVRGTFLVETASGTEQRFGTAFLINGVVTVNFTSIDTPATTALVNATLQSFFYSNRSDTPPSQVTLDLTFTDSDGEVAVGTTQAVINITATDDVTTVSDLPTSLDFTEDTPLGNFDISAATFADVDSASISVTIEVAAGGTFTLADPAGLITVAGDGTDFITLTGAPADINTYLNTPANVRYSPPQDLNGTPATTATVTANGDTLGTIDINIAPVRDDPVNTVPGPQVTDEDTPLTITGLSVADPDAGTITTTVSVDTGLLSVTVNGFVLTLPSVPIIGTPADINAVLATVVFRPNDNFTGTATLTIRSTDGNATDIDTVDITVNPVNDAPEFTGLPANLTVLEDITTSVGLAGAIVSDVDNAQISLSVSAGAGTIRLVANGNTFNLRAVSLVGTPAQINAVLATFQYTGATNANGADTLTFVANDGLGGITTQVIDVAITSVNDAPAGTDATLTINEDAPRTFSAADFGFTDTNDTPADGLANVIITTLPVSGTLTLNGMAVMAGQVIPANQIGNLVYTPVNNVNGNGAASFTFQVQDDGGTANGGVDTDQTPNTLTIDITPVNDAPAGTDATLTINEDVPRTFSAADFGFTDTNDTPADGLANVIITTLPVSGTLTLNGMAVMAGQVIPANQIGNLVYTPANNVNGNGAASFTFQVQDDGGTANGGVDTDQTPNTLTIDITPVNDAPAGTDATLTINEDVPRTFSAADFGFTDTNDMPADGLANVIITTLPVSGTLTLNGMVVMAGQVIPANQIDNLIYTPANNVNGNGAASFTFQVQDDGGTANGGVDTDQTPNTLTIDITPVNDAPVNTVPGPQVINEDTTLVFSAGNGNQLSVADVDAVGGTVSTVLNVGSGTLTVTPAVGANIVGGGTNTVTITGTVAQVNAALATVTYSTPLNFNGADTLTVTTNDNGNTGAGGALTDIDTVDITINPVNDAPVNSVPGTQNTDNDTDLVFSAASGNRISISDVDSGTGTMTTILAVPSGALTAAVGSGAIIVGNGSANVAISGTVAQVNAALSLVTYIPDGLTVGTIALSVTTNDNGNIGGGNLIDTDQILIELASGLGSTGTDGQNPSDPAGQSNDNQPSNFNDTPGNPIGFQNGNPGQDPLLAGLPGFGGGRSVDDIITAGIGDRTSGENGVSESDLPGNIDLHPTSDTGFSNLDDITSDTTPLLTGKAPADTIVTIKSSLGGVLGTVTADENGQWRFAAPSLSDGVHEFIATPTDEDGKEGVPSIPLLVTIDTVAPDTPPAPAFDGDADQLRSNETPTFKGKAEPGARIVLTSDPDGVVGEVVADENGNWQVTTGLSENTHQLTLTATDAAGNTSPSSPALELVVRAEDDTALHFDATSPVLASITGPDGSVGFDSTNITALLSGFADQVDVSHFEQIRSSETGQALGFTRQLQKAGNTVNDNLLASL